MDPEESAPPVLNQGEEAAEAAEPAPAEEERAPPVQEVPAGEGSRASGGEAAAQAHPEEEEEELARQVMEVGLQNEYLRSQIAGARPAGGADEGSELVRGLKEQVEKLTREVQEQRLRREATEKALGHVNVAYAEADSKVQELTAKLAQAEQKMEKELKERDDKYVELDTKFQRLHKRAKQRIQDIQKEKDDLEARFNEVNQKAEQAASLQLAAQQELERARQQASEALRSMDVERQQLRTVNSKLRANLDETRLALEARNNSLEKLQQSVLEKEQLLEKVQGSLQSAEDKRMTIISELTAKHQKQLESLQAQLAEVSAERIKASETIQSLQEKERLSWEATCESLRSKLEASENARLKSEIESAKVKGQLELELSTQNQLLQTKDSDLMAGKQEISRLESEFSAYKVRAHALLQKKDAELNAAKSSDLVKEHEEAMREAEKEVAAALAERDKAIHDLQEAQSRHCDEIEARDMALADAEKKLKNVMKKLDSVSSNFITEKESWEKNMASVEENWRLKYESLKAQSNGHVDDELQKNLGELTLKYEKLKEEHQSFRDIADRMIEEKEREIAKLLKENRDLHHSLEAKPPVSNNDCQSQGPIKDTMSVELAEQQILLLARQQAQREEELAQSQRHILALQQEIEELERENRLHDQQEAMLKTELRSMERSQKREGIDMTYLKNVILKLLETGEVGALLPVVATLLQFSPDELKKCQQGVLSSVASSQAAALSDGTTTPNSFFSRFSF
ncbi:protein GRIP isoform X1 [Panicum miliaceum]|uniref:Protein GRIP isoform X1 n=1 Tax=Panicum miliaceum TaxID=4540 RepID=A0A3L6T6X3_PANMI|nr:protein GRIP isoform X1 [Panicum miliaceum]